MKRSLALFRKQDGGGAAAEMALVAPMLIILMFGALELGNYFLSEHIVVKAVRDGARFAARQSYTNMPCTGGVPSGTETFVRNVVRTGTMDGTGTARLWYWTDPTTITVSVNCYPNLGSGGTTVYSGVYEDMANVPRVTVSAIVPYTPLVGAIGFDTIGINLRAANQANVIGV